MKKLELFSVPVYQGFFPHSDVDGVIEKLLNRNNEYVSLNRDTPIYKGDQVFDIQKEFPEFIDEMKRKFLEIDRKEYSVINSWVNISNEGDGHNRHDHYQHNVYWNIVWYLKYEDGNGEIEFFNDSYSRYLSNNTETNHIIIPMQFMWIAFPSWLPHHTRKNTLNSDRVSLVLDLGVEVV